MARRRRGRTTPPAPATPAAPAAPIAPALPVREITIDLRQLKITDLRLISLLRRGKLNDEESIPLLDRAIVGGLGDLTLADMGQVLATLFSAVYGTGANPETPEGN